MNKKISIIIPTYNLDKYIGRCLDSVTNQTYKNIEIVVVDDGSKDNTPNIIKEYANKDLRIKYILKENGGVSSARLAGIKMSTGDYIGFIDGDDYVDCDMYQRLMDNMIKYDADISHCAYEQVFKDGNINKLYGTGLIKEQDNREGLKDLLEGKIIEPGLCNKLFKRELFENIREDDSYCNIKFNEDLLLNYDLFKNANKSIFEDICLYKYAMNEASASHQDFSEHRIYDPIKVREIILRDCIDDIKGLAQKSYLNTCVYIYCGLVISKNKDFLLQKKDIRKKITERYKWRKQLEKSTKILAFFIVRCPRIFNILYRLYSK